jgi:hypothetical protein
MKMLAAVVSGLALMIAGCSDDDPVSTDATLIAGIGFFADAEDCDAAAEGAAFALLMTGDLEGCLHVFVEESRCYPIDGTYLESGTELFDGTYRGETGTFRTTYTFQGRYEGCNPDNGTFAGAELSGGCQHPIVRGSGEGVFAGLTAGRFDIEDDIAAANFPYTGFLSWSDTAPAPAPGIIGGGSTARC